MATRPQSTLKRKSTVRRNKKKQPVNPVKRWLIKSVVVFLVFGAFLLASYIGYLDYNVRNQFEGKRWAIPARVYASPLELYTGHKMTIANLESHLKFLHYREDPLLSSEGTFSRQASQITIKTRTFSFWDEKQDSRLVNVQFFDSGIARIFDATLSKDLTIFRLDSLQIGSFYPTRKEDRVLIKLAEAPPTLIQGLLATEDRDFYQHYGISFKAIARAIWANVRAGGIVQGGSTITQQLIKNFYLTNERSFVRKINEVFMSLIIEYRYDKDEILEAYLNEVYLGQDGASAVHGFGLASEFYFGQPLKNLPLTQVASLVALVRGPSYYDPRRYPERALERRDLVLDKMAEMNYINEQQRVVSKNEPLKVIANTHRSANRYPAFLDLVKRQLKETYKEEDLTSEGLNIFTTLEPHVQDALEKTVAEKIKELQKNPRARDLETAVVVTRKEDGEIVGLVGGSDPKSAGFNRAVDAVRPIGSLIKPFVYLTALEYPSKYTITTPVSDTTIRVKAAKGQLWEPKNYDNTQHGIVSFHKALANSYNLATVRIGMDIGVARVAKTLRSMGITRSFELFPSFLLGASPLTPMEVTQIYQTLAGDGFTSPLRSIRGVVNSEGKRLQSYPFTVRQTVDPSATYITNTIMQEVMNEGTGRSAYNYVSREFQLVGKTGTTNEMRDSWFAGFSGDYLSVVWVGRDDNKPAGLTGSTGALKLWASLMQKISSRPVLLTPPDNVDLVWIDPFTGLLANKDCPGVSQFPYIRGSAPKASSPCVNGGGSENPDTWLNNLFQ